MASITRTREWYHDISDDLVLCDAAQQLIAAWTIHAPSQEERITALRATLAAPHNTCEQVIKLACAHPNLVPISVATGVLDTPVENMAILVMHVARRATWPRPAILQLVHEVHAPWRYCVVLALRQLVDMTMPDWPCGDDTAFLLDMHDAGNFFDLLCSVLHNFVPNDEPRAAALRTHVRPLFERLASDDERMRMMSLLLRTMTSMPDDVVAEVQGWVAEDRAPAVALRCAGARDHIEAGKRRACIAYARNTAVAAGPDQVARDGDLICKVCCDKRVALCFTACGHAVSCSGCFMRSASPKCCYTCRAPVTLAIALRL